MTTASQTPGEPAELAALVCPGTARTSCGTAGRGRRGLSPDSGAAAGRRRGPQQSRGVLADQGQLDEAAAQYEQAIELKPAYSQAYDIWALSCGGTAGRSTAAAHAGASGCPGPRFADAYNNLGNVLWDLRAARSRPGPDTNERLRSSPILPRRTTIWETSTASKASSKTRRPDTSRPSRSEPITSWHAAIWPTFSGCRASSTRLRRSSSEWSRLVPHLAEVESGEANRDPAAARPGQAAALKSDLAEAHNNLGTALKNQGRFDEALADYAQAIAFRPDHAGAHYNRADLKTFRPGDPDLAALEAIAADPGRLPPGKMLHIHFARSARRWRTSANIRAAFEQWLQGNALKRREIFYDEVGLAANVSSHGRAFRRRPAPAFAGAGDPSAAPIFIVGMPRSGQHAGRADFGQPPAGAWPPAN